MDLAEIERHLESLSKKMVVFSNSLSDEEKDVFASILALAAREGRQSVNVADNVYLSEPLPDAVEEVFAFSPDEVLAHLPRKATKAR